MHQLNWNDLYHMFLDTHAVHIDMVDYFEPVKRNLIRIYLKDGRTMYYDGNERCAYPGKKEDYI